MRGVVKSVSVLAAMTLLVGGVFVAQANAMQFSSSDFVIDAATLNNVGGFSSSGNYQLTSSGGEAAIGNGASGSYKLAAGYVAQVITPQITVQTQPSGLVAYYPMDEGSGPVAHDASANNLNGEIDGPTWTNGLIDKALSFDGSNNRGAVGIEDYAQLHSNALTVEAWINTTHSANHMAIIGKQGAFVLFANGEDNNRAAGVVNFDEPSGDSECYGTTPVTDGSKWYHIVATIQSGVVDGTKLYVDGVLEATCRVTIQNQVGAMYIGAYDGWYNYAYTGLIDQVKIFNRILSADEVAAEYDAQSQGIATGLSLSTIVPGASNSSDFDTIVQTSGSSYTLAINQDHDLQSGSSTIPAISGSIASPASWSEGTTKGLGFSVVSSTATAPSASWSSGSSYAALPSSATSFYTRVGTQDTSKDVIGMRLRADVSSTQASGHYTNKMTITGTANP